MHKAFSLDACSSRCTTSSRGELTQMAIVAFRRSYELLYFDNYALAKTIP